MLNYLEISGSEAIIFENLENVVERVNDLEELDHDRWATVAHLCDKVKSLEQRIKNLENEKRDLEQFNKTLMDETLQLNKTCAKALEIQEELFKLFKNLKF